MDPLGSHLPPRWATLGHLVVPLTAFHPLPRPQNVWFCLGNTTFSSETAKSPPGLPHGSPRSPQGPPWTPKTCPSPPQASPAPPQTPPRAPPRVPQGPPRDRQASQVPPERPQGPHNDPKRPPETSAKSPRQDKTRQDKTRPDVRGSFPTWSLGVPGGPWGVLGGSLGALWASRWPPWPLVEL